VTDPEERYQMIKDRTMLDTPVEAVIAACDGLLAT